MPVSDNFRDLERSDSAHRKDAVLMAAISGLECLDHPTRQDMARFSRLFMPLYATASPDVRRTASATMSRLSRVPEDVAEMLINEPIAIAAPFIAHYPLLKESALARAVARNGAPHARAAARRADLSPKAIATLQSLNDPSVEGLLILRGLIPDPALPPRGESAPAMDVRPAVNARPVVDAPPLDPSEKLRAVLKELALRSPAPRAPLNRPVSTRKLPDAVSVQPATKPTETDAADRPPMSAAVARRMNEARFAQLARYAKPDQESWFATALADAMGTSFALAERIMMDVSGRQLATALVGLGAPAATIKSALESFFPHLAQAATSQTLANELIAQLDNGACAARLQAWQRADSYSNGGTLHVPALADGKPVRQPTGQRAPRQDIRKAFRRTG